MSVAAPHVLTRSTVKFRPTQPEPSAIVLEDIAYQLSRKYRWGGATQRPYTVIQHALDVAEALPEPLKLWGLLHDGAEAYLFDAQRPIKGKLFIACPYGDAEAILPYDVVEQRILYAIALRFALPWPIPPEVWAADDRALVTESLHLGVPPDVAVPAVEPFESLAHLDLSPTAAREKWISEARALLKDRDA